MNFFRKLITYRKLALIVAIGMLLRSTIAVGYMLDTNPENGDLFSIILCEGPAEINAIAGLDNHNDSHAHHHGYHSENDNNDDGHNHAIAQDYPASSCSFWSASSLSLFAETTFLNTANDFVTNELITYERFLINRLSNNSRLARAPPPHS